MKTMQSDFQMHFSALLFSSYSIFLLFLNVLQYDYKENCVLQHEGKSMCFYITPQTNVDSSLLTNLFALYVGNAS